MSPKVTAREILRATVYTFGLSGLLNAMRRARGNTYSLDTAKDIRGRFSDIYQKGLWKLSAEHPYSGAGSSDASAASVGARLPELMRRFAINSLIDIGCGDLTWMQSVDLGCDYIGVDVVPSVIASNTATHGSPHRTFLCLDATCDALPAADAALCRDVLFHLSFEDAKALLRNVQRSGHKFLLATSDPATQFNANIHTGDFRIINLRRAPFRFPAPMYAVADDRITVGRILGMWRVEELPEWTRT